MTATTRLRAPAVDAAAEVRRRKQRRRRIGFWVSLAAMVVVIATVVVLALGFNNSWWVQQHPVASNDQIASDGSSVFTQAGIDYYTRIGTVNVTMTGTRPAASALGLPSSGTKHESFLVPLTVAAKGEKTVTFPDAQGLDLITSGGAVSAIELRPSAPYQELLGDVASLAPKVGWSSAAVSQFNAAVVASRQANNGDSFSATIGPAASTGMRVSATLSGNRDVAPVLVIRLEAARYLPGS